MKLVFILMFVNYSFASVPHIRVRLAENQKFIKVTGKKLTNSIIIPGNKKKYNNQKNIVFDCQKTRSAVGGQILKIAEVSSSQNILSWNKKSFFGDFVIVGNQSSNSCDLVQKIDMESYISSVVSKEMRSDWPIEALKAQAVAARSYALFRMNDNPELVAKKIFHLENSEKHQVSGSLEEQSYQTHQAALQTHGEVLTDRRGKKIPVFYHSKCGGKTMLPQDIWANPISGYESVYCPFCHGHGKKPWKISFRKESLKNYMKKVLNRYYPDKQFSDQQLAMNSDDRESKNVSFKDLKYVFMRKSDLRKKLGREKMPSNFFHIEDRGDQYTVRGKGYGHGVGMCQFGAYELAKRGYNYKQILKHYFPNFNLTKAY